MALRVEKAAGVGFCFGVRRAIDTLEKVARERGRVETLGAVVHNQQVLQRLADIGVRVANSVDDIESDTVVIGTHGVDLPTTVSIRTKAFAAAQFTSSPLSSSLLPPPGVVR